MTNIAEKNACKTSLPLDYGSLLGSRMVLIYVAAVHFMLILATEYRDAGDGFFDAVKTTPIFSYRQLCILDLSRSRLTA